MMNKRLRVLLVPANPDPMTFDRLGAELQEIAAKVSTRSIELRRQRWESRAELLKILHDAQAEVIHFCGSGVMPGIVLSREEGPATPHDLQEWFSPVKNRIRLVLLDSCFSESQAEAITQVIDCAIGFRPGVGDTATNCLVSLYSDLSLGKSVRVALEGAKTPFQAGLASRQSQALELRMRRGVDPASLFFADRPETAVEEESVDISASQIVIISPLAFVRSMWTILWTAFRHPFKTTEVDLSTGQIARQF